MAKGTVDLRAKSFAAPAALAPAARHEENHEEMAWTALEHEERERGPYWFLGPGIAALALVIFGIFAHSYFFIAFVVLAYAVLIAYAHRPPREISFRIASDGFWAGTAHHPYAGLKSFWIFSAPDHRELSLETAHLLSPYLRIPL